MLINENLQIICNQVKEKMPHFTDQFIVDICNELVTLGAVPDEDDLWLILFSIQKAEAHILNQTNQATIPDGLSEVAVDMICGNFIQTKYLSGKLCLTDLHLDDIVRSVTQGDTTVTFEPNESDESKIRKMIDWLMNGKGCDLLCYRKMRW